MLGAAGPEGATCRQIGGIRGQTLDRREPVNIQIQSGQRTEQTYGIGMGCMVVDVLQGTVFHDLPCIDDCYLIADLCHNAQIGVAMGAICVNLLTLAMSKLGLPLNVQNVLVYSLFLLFIIYNTNKRKFAYGKAKRARIALAQQTKAARQPA